MSIRQKVSRWSVLTAKCPYGKVSSRRDFLTGKCPYGEVSVRRTVRTANCPYGELSVRRTVRTANCPYGELSVRRNVRTANCPYGELSVRRNVLRWNVLRRRALLRKVREPAGHVQSSPTLERGGRRNQSQTSFHFYLITGVIPTKKRCQLVLPCLHLKKYLLWRTV